MKKIIHTAVVLILTIILPHRSAFSSINTFINNVSPGQNVASVINSSNIIINFTQNMNASTFNSSNIFVYGMQTGRLALTVTYDAPAKSLKLDPVNNFKPGELISVTLTSGIKTSSNIPITQFVYTFNVKTTGGHGIFSQSPVIDSVISYWDAGDIDNDGDIDIAAASYQLQRINIYKNNSSGVFSLNSFIQTFGSLNLCDFNADGSVDVLVGWNNSVSLFANDGIGNFSFVSANYGRTGQLSDMNGDGYIDVVYLGNGLTNYFLKNTNGGFVLADSNSANACNDGDIRVGDYNNDGFPDISEITDCWWGFLEMGEGDRNVIVYYNSSATTFTATNVYYAHMQMREYAYAGLAGNLISVNYANNGNMDIVTALKKLSNSGSGNFTAVDFIYFQGKPVAGDYNGDGWMDLAAIDDKFGGAKLSILWNENSPFKIETNNKDFYWGINGDFDSDGDLDLLHNLNGYLYVLFNNNCSPVSFNVNGPSRALVNHVYKYSNPDPANWELYNGYNCNAFIIGNTFDDTISVNTGTNDSYFALRVIVPDSCGGEVRGNYYVTVSPCLVSGNQNVTSNTIQVYYSQHLPNAHWELWNNISAQASIIGSIRNDSVLINTGSSTGYFVLSYVDSTNNYYDRCDFNVTIDAPLPVELSSFTANVSSSNVTLNWTTSSEENNSGFAVERSDVKGQLSNDWINLGFVQGNGNSNNPQSYSYVDRNLSAGTYNYRLKQIDYNGNFRFYDLGTEVVIGVPDRFELLQNYPNPFNPTTIIKFNLPQSGFVTLKIYDVTGKEVKTILNEYKDAGYFNVNVNAADLSSGVYFYSLHVQDFIATRKMVVLK